MEQTQLLKVPSGTEFLDNLKESKLLSPEDMERALQAAANSADRQSLALDLVDAGVLTAFQVEAIRERKYADLRIGQYEVLDRLGAGGMGTVFKGRHRRMKRIVALKVLSPAMAKDENFLRRFQREVETIARLSHPNIVMAFDADESEAGPFLVMEYVKGHDLATLVGLAGPLDVSAAVNCILQAARGLEYAHSQGMIHRDVKPANLLCDDAGVVKVTDLGLARFNSLAAEKTAAGSAITQAGSVMGTVDYMSPEQAVDTTTIDRRADIYSLGATFYFILFGVPPYQATTMMAALLKHRDAPIPSLAALNKEVPADVDNLFRRMMAKAPGDRPESMAEVVRVLESCAMPHVGTLVIPAFAPLVDAMRAATPPPVGRNEETAFEAAPQTNNQTAELKQTASPSRAPLKVLLVEPSRTQAGIIRKYLQTGQVANVVAAASGQDALKAVKNELPDVIVSALHLPDMTGVQLAQRMNEEHRTAAPGFVLISSESEGPEAGTLSKCGRALLLHKPFTPEQLNAALKMLSAPLPPATAKVDRAKVRVLIVDDSVAARRHVQGVLKGLGISQLVEAADGAQAVAAVAKETFDLIITDYNMPYMDGRGLIGYLKQNPATASVPIVMITTEQDEAKLEAVRQLGVAAICDKSLRADVVQEIIDQIPRKS